MATVVLTVIAMLAFAGNSILCRLALQQELIDPASFTAVRAASGAIVLTLIVLLKHDRLGLGRAAWLPATMLFVYMICFSFAYVSLSAGTGALILFGAVQITMIVAAIRAGESLTLISAAGFAIAIAGLIWLVSPGVTAPDLTGALLMAGAGVAWGFYSLLGRKQQAAIMSTAANFVLALPMAAIASLALIGTLSLSWSGTLLAATSGAVTSGLGYVVWYSAVPRLSATQGASVQLTVPVIAAVFGVLLLAESVSTRLIVASIAILGGVWLVVTQRTTRAARPGSR